MQIPDPQSFTALVIEDDARLAALVARYLGAHGVAVVLAATGRDGLREAAAARPDVVVLDWMLPDLAGDEVCRRLRVGSDVPVVMLTARDGEMDRVRGLDAGADDYVVKPFSSPELLARLRAQVRRHRGMLRPSAETLALGPLRIDVGARAATIAGSPMNLTTYEFDLLVVMASRPGRVLSRETLLELVTGSADEVFDRAIDVHISRLRLKLGDNPRAPRLLRTVRGVGYVLSWSDP